MRQDPEAAPAPDNAILAAETGLPLEEIDQAMAFREEFSSYAEEPISRFPDQITAVWAASPPGARGPSTRGHSPSPRSSHAAAYPRIQQGGGTVPGPAGVLMRLHTGV